MTRAQAVKAVLDRMRSEIGLGETPPGSNNNRIVQWYNDEVERIGRGPWCQMTVTWAFWTGVGRIVRGRAYTVWAAQDFLLRNEGTWTYGLAGAQPGDMIFYDWGGRKGDTAFIDHVGLVERVNGDGTVYTLEGNYGDRLVRMHRDSKYVVGLGRADWSKVVAGGGSSAPVPAPKPPAAPAAGRVAVDGWLGPKTIKAWQRAMGTSADGVISYPRSELVAAVQRHLNKKGARLVVDGKGIASNESGRYPRTGSTSTLRALQRYLGVSADGYLSAPSDAVKALQRKLNTGKF
ncbi:CHAP domain-containing protein [Phycicoccus avicenniae]|uniref:CHAP domain-containing protein n=1 Tax=Phycicoccus avicenniae TaxID=2828860 RepID=UPI003D2DD848